MLGRSKLPKPSVSTDWAELVYDPRQGGWTLTYEGIPFHFAGPQLRMPDKAWLDIYIGWIDSHRKHIDTAVTEMAAGWTDVEVHASAAHPASVEIERPNRIAVVILGDESWGDMGYDLWIEDGVIVKEGFGD